jgi:hypothetical protein
MISSIKTQQKAKHYKLLKHRASIIHSSRYSYSYSQAYDLLNNINLNSIQQFEHIFI